MATTMGSIDLKTFKDLRDDVTQYFWFESNASASYGAGVHITLSPESTFKTTPSGQNILMNTDGLSIRNGLLPMMVLDNDSLDFNAIDTLNGTYTNIATFGTTGARIGQMSGAHSIIDANGQRFYASDGTTQLANIGYGEGESEIGTAIAPYYTLGIRRETHSIYSPTATYDVGDITSYNGTLYVCKVAITTPEAWNADHWALGNGNYSVAEGLYTLASGVYSHAEGTYAQSSGQAGSHAEGLWTKATGSSSHAEGAYTIASGAATHAQNFYTTAKSAYQTALGKYNVVDNADTYAVIIGNGTADNARSDALEVEWNGNTNIAGSLFTNMTDEFAKGSGTNHVIIGGYHVCWGIESVTTSTSYSEVEVALPYTYSSVNTFLPFASIANRTAQARSAYATIKDESTLYVGAVATTSRTVNVVWMTIGT